LQTLLPIYENTPNCDAVSVLERWIRIHALIAMMNLLSPFIHGVSAKLLGIGKRDDEGYLQCPDSGKPYTCGGTVVFKVRRLSRVF